MIRYGVVIGYAKRAIARGSWVHEGLLNAPGAPPLADCPLATAVPEPLPKLEGYSFMGYRNRDGSVGTKNILGISTTVQCVAATVDYAVRRIKAELLPKYPNVDDVVAIAHHYGCGVAIDAPGAAVPIRTLRNLALNPNFGGEIMIVSRGCEKLQPARMIPASELPILEEEPSVAVLQDVQNGFGEIVANIMAQAEAKLKRLNERRRVACAASDLVVGLQCGGSDAFSGVTANPAVGWAADLLVRAGATVMFSGGNRGSRRCAPHHRARSDTGDRARLYSRNGLVRQLPQHGRCGPPGQSHAGQQKGRLGQYRREGNGLCRQGGQYRFDGRCASGRARNAEGPAVFAATPASDFICGTLQLAAAMNLHVFTTGRGTPYGLSVVPVIKVATNSGLASRWHDLIDVDAGRIATADATVEDVGWEIFKLILEVASGSKKTWADHWGLHNEFVLFNPGPVT